ncbi:MAG: site-2 protease family protein [Candidatus Kerfeldbacteria bacterium]|nr:site-2 protease family protein [Candidatus Kerfeldbacteria bacterium]
MLLHLLQTQPLYIFPWLITVLISIGIHEFCHALAGYLQGDDTAQREGRLTLNPLAHIDWLGLMLLVVAGFGWGKPTPFNPYNLKYKKWGSAIVSMAGPASNVVLALASLTAYKLAGFSNPLFDQINLLAVFLLFMVQMNVVLFVFNLIPIPPLDGSKVLYTFLGYRRQNIIVWLERNGFWLLLGLVFLGQGILQWLMGFVLLGLYQLFGFL